MRLVGTIAAAIALAASAACPAAGASTFRAPIDPPTIDPGCDYGSRSCEYSSYHAGIDYLGDDPPNEPVMAAADGHVAVAATSSRSHGFGNAVILRHELPGGATVYTLYAHMAAAPKVHVGQCVSGGARLGIQGRSGDTSNVSTHFEFKTKPKFGPPYGYSPGPPDDFGYFDPKSFIGKRKAVDVCGTHGGVAAAPCVKTVSKYEKNMP